MHAFVWLRTAPARIDEVVADLAGIPGVRNAVSTTGPWDVLAAVEGSDAASIAGIVKRRILAVEGVTRSSTAPVVPLDLIGISGGGWATPGLPLSGSGAACFVSIRATAGAVAGL